MSMTTETSKARGEWVLVPRVPSDEMLDAGMGKFKSGGLWNVYAAMVAAAPPPAAARGDVPYDRDLIARMLDVCGHPKYTLDAYMEQARLLREADSAGAANVGTASIAAEGVQAGEVEQKLKPCPTCAAPCEYEVKRRGGDYGWSTTDEQRTFYKFNAAALSQQPEARGAVDAAIVDFVAGYEFCGEDSQGREGYYTPNERERMLIEDAIRGWEVERHSAAVGERHG